MSALIWKETTPGQVEAISRQPIAIYEISEVQISKRQSECGARSRKTSK
jgi:hypothetical protein